MGLQQWPLGGVRIGLWQTKGEGGRHNPSSHLYRKLPGYSTQTEGRGPECISLRQPNQINRRQAQSAAQTKQDACGIPPPLRVGHCWWDPSL